MPDDTEKDRQCIWVGRVDSIGEYGTDRLIELFLRWLQVIGKSMSFGCVQKERKHGVDGL